MKSVFMQKNISSAFKRSMLLVIGALALTTSLLSQKSTAKSLPYDTRNVDPFIGVDWGGNTFVGSTIPYGMVKLGPDMETHYTFPASRQSLMAVLSLPSINGQEDSKGVDELAPTAIPRMVAPSIDLPGVPFSYPSKSTDQIGVMYSPSGTEITPEGYLYSGFGELMFYVGVDRQPVAQRLRTLEDGHLPIVCYEVEHEGLLYRFLMFAASLGPEQNGQRVVNFVRVTVHNPGKSARRGFVTSAWRYSGPQTTVFPTGDNRFRRPVMGKRVGDYWQPGEAFHPESAYSVKDNAFLRDGAAVYFFPAEPKPYLTPTYRDYYNRIPAPNAQSRVMPVLPDTPVATAEYALNVPAGSDRSVDFKMPLIPVAPDSPEFNAVQQASLDERHQQVRHFWNGVLAEGMQIVTSEKKVNDTFDTSLVNDLLSLNKIGDDYVQTVNQLQYHGFYLRDSADFVRMYDTTGYAQIAGHVVDFFASRQGEDGLFLSQPGQYDGWGEALWTYGEHYRMTRDRAFAVKVYPRVLRAVNWLEKAMADDPMHIVPSTDIHDNEYISGHLTGYNFLALDGLEAAALLAHDLGHNDDELRIGKIEESLRKNFMSQLDRVTAKTGGYIPPALDGDTGGTDWGNLLSLVPEQQLSPLDSRVTATLRATQARYEEDLVTYRQPGQGTYLHHYLTIKNTLTELIRGEQKQAIREFYAVLLHTSSTNAGFEYSIRPWGDRDFSGNLAPHGWFAAEYRNLLRDMMVREEGDTLHLLSAVSPAWIGAGKSLNVEKAQTYFGTVGFSLKMPSATQAELSLHTEFASGHTPKKIVLHLPWFMDVAAVNVDGRPVSPVDHEIQIAPTAKSVHIAWKRRLVSPDVPSSYEVAVQRYKAEYAKRYRELNGEGQ
jgi:hypothetical protein